MRVAPFTAALLLVYAASAAASAAPAKEPGVKVRLHALEAWKMLAWRRPQEGRTTWR